VSMNIESMRIASVSGSASIWSVIIVSV